MITNLFDDSEDLLSIGVTALGPRKKIVHALSELRKGGTKSAEIQIDPSEVISDETDKLLANKLITDYFPGFSTDRKKGCDTSGGRNKVRKHCSDSSRKRVLVKNQVTKEKPREIPLWCCIAGTPFRVLAKQSAGPKEFTHGCIQVPKKRLFLVVPYSLPHRS
ncbi:hypothetical protein RJ640_018728 [Escallonia rubra]|uniref:SAM domain-containing protein n=1 Tax=Escallonia rubra TaxID=112253 RepID=A0AA88QCL5_9ASTE|nr:hypothetical protein RJ640_018728 [Escallonia rubra]